MVRGRAHRDTLLDGSRASWSVARPGNSEGARLAVELATLAQAIVGAAALVGALVGAAGFATIASRQPRRIARVIDALAAAEGPVGSDDDPAGDPAGDLVLKGIHDRALRASLATLSNRLATTWRLATVDQLTSVLNRQAIVARLAHELERGARYERMVSVILVDLDHFKRVNDDHGHAVGDAILRGTAGTLARNVRAADEVGRYGGEEFLIVLPETGPGDAAKIAEKLRRLVAAVDVQAPGGARVAVTLSAGVAGGPCGTRHIDALIREADDALYVAKSSGRDQVVIHGSGSEFQPIAHSTLRAETRAQASAVGRAAARAATGVLMEALVGRAGESSAATTALSETAGTMARSFGLPGLEVERIRAAGLLHDLGDLAIPEEVLAHPGQLGPDDWKMVTEHPKVGQIILEQAGALRDAATIVLHHHERFDGRGYPHGLAGEEIPIGSRIVAVIDAYQAMTEGRPYQGAISREAAIDELRRQSGSQFDPGVVEAFIALQGREIAAQATSDSLPPPTSDHDSPVAVDADLGPGRATASWARANSTRSAARRRR